MSTMADIIAAHTADWVDWDTSEKDSTYYRCICGTAQWHVNTSADYHEAHAAHVAEELTKAGYGKLEGEKEWGVQREVASPQTSREAAEYEIERQRTRPKGYQTYPVLVSRTVTAWKKEEGTK